MRTVVLVELKTLPQQVTSVCPHPLLEHTWDAGALAVRHDREIPLSAKWHKDLDLETLAACVVLLVSS